MPAILLWFLGPIGKWVSMALLCVSVVGVFAIHEYNKGRAYERAQQVKAEAAAVERGAKARDDAGAAVDGGVRDSRDTDK